MPVVHIVLLEGALRAETPHSGQAHGLHPDSLLRPSWEGQAGWPVLMPMKRVADFAWVPHTAMPDEAMDILVRRGTLE